jgi:hypothetical protein
VLDELMRKSADPPLEQAARSYSELIGAGPTSTAAVRSLVRLAFEFTTWEILADRGMTDPEMAMLMRRAVASAVGRR